MRILYGLLNWRKEILTPKRSLNKIIKSKDNDEIYIVTLNKGWKESDFKLKTTINLRTDETENVAKTKNLILKYAKENNFDYCVILEDDIIVKNGHLVSYYISLMNKFNLSVSMSGYLNANWVLNNKVNPCLMVRITKEGDELYVNRFCCSGFMVFKIEENLLEFDERLDTLELPFLLQSLTFIKKIPFNGFFFDLKESFKLVKRNLKLPKIRKCSYEMNVKDLKVNDGTPLALDNDVDKLLKYIKDKI